MRTKSMGIDALSAALSRVDRELAQIEAAGQEYGPLWYLVIWEADWLWERALILAEIKARSSGKPIDPPLGSLWPPGRRREAPARLRRPALCPEG